MLFARFNASLQTGKAQPAGLGLSVFIQCVTVLITLFILSPPAIADSTYVCAGIYNDATAAAAACASDKGSSCSWEIRNQNNHHCPITEPGTWSTDGYYRSTGLFPNSTYYYYEAWPSGCPDGQTPDPNTGECIDAGACDSAENKLAPALAKQWYALDNNVTTTEITQIPTSAFSDCATPYVLSAYTSTACVSLGGIVCQVVSLVNQNINADNALEESNLITSITTVQACSSGISNQADTNKSLCDEAPKETETTTEGTTITQRLNRMFDTAIYDPATDTTTRCHIVVTTISVTGQGDQDYTTENCDTAPGDTTKEGAGTGIQIIGEPGTQTPGADNGEIVNPDGYSADEIKIDLSDLCTDPNGCEDFGEVLTSYDNATDLGFMGSAIESITDAMDVFSEYWSGLGTDVSSLTSGVDVGNIADSNIIPAGQTCQVITLQLPRGHVATFDCNRLGQIRQVLSMILWFYLAMYVRSVMFRPKTT